MPRTSGTLLMRPLPGSGRRATLSPRAGRSRPESTATMRMMMSGTACDSPVSDAEPARQVGLEQGDLALEDPDPKRGDHRDRERGEPAHQRGRERGQDRDREDRPVQREDRREQDRGQSREEARDEVVDELDASG